jgi:hypothetical protein
VPKKIDGIATFITLSAKISTPLATLGPHYKAIITAAPWAGACVFAVAFLFKQRIKI